MVKIEFTTGNAAFRTEDERLDEYEVARILKDIAEKIESGATSGSVIDYNGNKIGTWSIN